MTAFDSTLDPERFARVMLSCACEPGDASVGSLVAREGAAAAIDRIRESGGKSLTKRLDAAKAIQAIEHADRIGAAFVIPGDRQWPTQLEDLGDETPFGLWVLGSADLRFLALRSLAIVGARAATQYGVRTASLFASELAQRGWCVVSGGAYGIDAAAHRGALAVGASTVVVLASGVNEAYPTAHADLFDQCRRSGLVVSESAPDEPARRWRFLTRNRVIAALTRATVVVEAAPRSGALNTARCADDLGRFVLGVPGPVSSSASSGVHALIRSGATLVSNADEVITAVTAEGVSQQFDLVESLSRLGADAATTLTSLIEVGVADEPSLAQRLNLSVPDIVADLAGLELAGLVERHARGWQPTALVKEHRRQRDTGQMLDFTQPHPHGS